MQNDKPDDCSPAPREKSPHSLGSRAAKHPKLYICACFLGFHRLNADRIENNMFINRIFASFVYLQFQKRIIFPFFGVVFKMFSMRHC